MVPGLFYGITIQTSTLQLKIMYFLQLWQHYSKWGFVPWAKGDNPTNQITKKNNKIQVGLSKFFIYLNWEKLNSLFSVICNDPSVILFIPPRHEHKSLPSNSRPTPHSSTSRSQRKPPKSLRKDHMTHTQHLIGLTAHSTECH